LRSRVHGNELGVGLTFRLIAARTDARFTLAHDAPSCTGRIGILAHRFTLVS
jgi:hypothetical protein